MLCCPLLDTASIAPLKCLISTPGTSNKKTPLSEWNTFDWLRALLPRGNVRYRHRDNPDKAHPEKDWVGLFLLDTADIPLPTSAHPSAASTLLSSDSSAQLMGTADAGPKIPENSTPQDVEAPGPRGIPGGCNPDGGASPGLARTREMTALASGERLVGWRILPGENEARCAAFSDFPEPVLTAGKRGKSRIVWESRRHSFSC